MQQACQSICAAHLDLYRISTGSTGFPKANAPLEKGSRQLAPLVVPSGIIRNSGYLLSAMRTAQEAERQRNNPVGIPKPTICTP